MIWIITQYLRTTSFVHILVGMCLTTLCKLPGGVDILLLANFGSSVTISSCLLWALCSVGGCGGCLHFSSYLRRLRVLK